MMLHFLFEVLRLPFDTYFRPGYLQAHVATMVGKLPYGITPIGILLRRQRGYPEITQWWQKLGILLFVFPFITSIVTWLLFRMPDIGTLLLFGWGINLGLSLLFALRIGVPMHLIYITLAISVGVVFSTAIIISMGFFASIAATTSPDGISAAVNSPTGALFNALLLGSALGIMIRMFIGVSTASKRAGMIGGLIIIIPLVICLGLFSKPDIATTNLIAGLCALLGFTGWFCLPVQLLIAIISYVMVRKNLHMAARLWFIAPVYWDEFLMLPLYGTVYLIATLNRTNEPLYQSAVNHIKQHVFQARLIPHIKKAVQK
jgi:hypothetical protein